MTDHPASTTGWLDSIPYRIWRANQTLSRHLAASVEDLGVTVTQLGLAVHLGDLGHMSASELARLVKLTPQSTTTALGVLEDRGWVRRVPHPIHKRIIWYELTPLGDENVARGSERVAAINRDVEALIDSAAETTLIEALTAIIGLYADED